MLAETDLLGAFVPVVAIWFVGSLVLFVPIDLLLTKSGFYRLFWHAPLVRSALFAIIFSGGGLALSMR
ncbi:DUF1656 domain-containing protein [Bradyrhizobium genosp. A]|uniref:DUF1656 domain-containing protein n=1 Tax=Bradyrhizobium genosp. A TaxID=83626 RepID=UPI003CE6A9A9